MNKRLAPSILAAVAASCLLLAVYRLCFLWLFGPSASASEVVRVLGYGLRLDLALIGFELSLTGLLVLLFRRVRLQFIWWWMWLLLGLHAFVCAANLATFGEREQNVGELLLPYITLPNQIYLAAVPFLQQHPWLSGALAAAFVIFLWLGFRLGRGFGKWTTDSWAGRRPFFGTLALVILPLTLALQPVRIKRKGDNPNQFGWTAQLAEGKYYTAFSRRALNEAVVNPLLEFAVVQVPAHFKVGLRYHLAETDAEAIYFRGTGRKKLDARYPLLTPVRGVRGTGIENVIILQVEGLSGSVLNQERGGRAVTPFLRQLAREGLYFSNTLQNANFTSGGLFATVTSLPKATYDEAGHRFTGYEMSGCYSSLPHILGGSNYQHFFLEGFRHSSDDFLSFMAHQGFEGHGYGYFRDAFRRKGKLRDADTLLGIFDGYFLQECAAVLLRCPTRFTAHLVTCSTHSPWGVPGSFPRTFDKPELNAFAYLDHSIAAFVEQMKTKPEVWERTLLIVTGDHTSVTFGDTQLERLQVPLIFHAPKLPREPLRAGWASQLDVLPTTLALLGEDRWFCGMGNNLLEPAAGQEGIPTGTTQKGCYFLNGELLEYNPRDEGVRLFAVSGNADEDITGERPEVVTRLREAYFSQIEFSTRLSRSRQVFPVSREEFVRLSDVAARGP